MKKQNDIDELFRSSFEDFEVAPPASIKEAVDKAIDGRRRRGFLFWLVLFLAGSTSLYLLLILTTDKHSVPSHKPLSSGKHQQISTTQPAALPDSKSTVAYRTEGKQERPSETTNPSVNVSINDPVADAVTQPKSGKITSQPPHKQHQPVVRQRKKSTEDPAKLKPSILLTGQEGKRAVPPLRSHNPLDLAGGKETIGSGSGHATEKALVAETTVSTAKPLDTVVTSDSTTIAATEIPVDSSEAQPTATVPPPVVKPPLSSFWLLSAYSGPSLGINRTSKGFNVSEEGSQLVSLELERYWGNFGVHTGVGFGQRTERLELEKTIINDTGTSTSYQQNKYVASTLFIPMGMSWQRPFGTSPYGMRVSGQVALNFRWAKSLSANQPIPDTNELTTEQPVPISVNRFGVSTSLRMHFTYELNQFQFSLGIAGGMDFVPMLVPEGATRKHYYFLPQGGVHLRF